jgi:hypothetical protein
MSSVNANVEHALERSSEPTPVGGRGWVIAAAVFITLHIVLAWLGREIGVLTGQDDVEYLSLAESLRHGTYRELFHIGAPFHFQYPPGYPALLAVWGGIAGTGFDTLVVLNIVLSASALALLFLTLRRAFDARFAAVCVGVLAVNPELLRPAGAIMSEPAYLFFSLLALYCVVRAGDRTRWLVAAGAIAIVAALTRMPGLTLLVGLTVHWLLERRWKLVLIPAGLGITLLGGWLLWSALDGAVRPGFSYIAELQSLWTGGGGARPFLERMPRYALVYLIDFLPASLAIPTFPGTIVDNITATVLMCASLVAGWLVLLRRWRPAALYLVAYSALLTVWLWAVGRFLVPVVPLLVVALLAGGGALAARLREGARFAVTLVFAGILFAGGLYHAVLHVNEQLICEHDAEWPDPLCLTEDQRSYFEALRWIDRTLPQDAVLLTAKPGALWYYTDRYGVRYAEAMAQSRDSFVPWLREQGATHIVLAALWIEDAWGLADLILANCDRLRHEITFAPRTSVFRIDDVSPDEAAATCTVVNAFVRTVRGRAR